MKEIEPPEKYEENVDVSSERPSWLRREVSSVDLEIPSRRSPSLAMHVEVVFIFFKVLVYPSYRCCFLSSLLALVFGSVHKLSRGGGAMMILRGSRFFNIAIKERGEGAFKNCLTVRLC